MKILRRWGSFFFTVLLTVLTVIQFTRTTSTVQQPPPTISSQQVQSHPGVAIRSVEAPSKPAIKAAVLPVSGTRPTIQKSVARVSPAQALCAKPQTQVHRQHDTGKIYKWTDQRGQLHLSDTPPAAQQSDALALEPQRRNFNYRVLAPGITVPPAFNGQMAAASKRMYATWRFFLEDANLRQAQIELVLLADHEAFRSHRGRATSQAKHASGFYTIQTNQAVVKYQGDQLDNIRATSIHEISHLITATHLGPTSIWLTEGLAEYFENMHLQHQGGVISPNQRHLSLLKNKPLPSLADFIRYADVSWNDGNLDLNYAMAWSLVYFLMDGAPGNFALKNLIEHAKDNFCQPFSAARVLVAAYPGGVGQLEADWRQWLGRSDYSTHQI